MIVAFLEKYVKCATVQNLWNLRMECILMSNTTIWWNRYVLFIT